MTRIRFPASAPGVMPAYPLSMFSYPGSVTDVTGTRFPASAADWLRITSASPGSTMPVGSRSVVMVPVRGSKATMRKLANGVVPAALPTIETARPTGLKGEA